MEYDYFAAEEIRKEMDEFMKSIILNNSNNSKKDKCFDIQKKSSEITDSLIEITSNEYESSVCPIQITPPESEVSNNRVIPVHEGFTSEAKSTKPGNIKINLNKLCIVSCESIFPIVAATHTPWLIPFAALVICNKFWSLQNIPITERDAAVIWTMWEEKDSEDCVKAEMVLDLVNEKLSRYSRSQMTQQEFEGIIRNLRKIKCIEETKENKWHLLEEVKVTYQGI